MTKFNGMTQEQIDAQLKYALHHPDTNKPSDPVQQSAAMLAEQLQDVLKSNGAQPSEADSFDQNVQTSYYQQL